MVLKQERVHVTTESNIPQILAIQFTQEVSLLDGFEAGDKVKLILT
jgi:hypothetical protein